MKETNNYESYRKTMTKTEYFTKFREDDVQKISDELKEELYDKYLVKVEVFNRDSFKCQNFTCKAPSSPLTMHHIKWQKNGGKDSARNCVILCQSCHKNYHRGKFMIKFSDLATHLPPHIRGHTFRLEHPDEINWKQMRSEMKKIRKQLKYSNSVTKINWTMMERMMKIFEDWLREY